MAVPAPDLTKGPPRRGREMLGGYVWLARLADKARAAHAGTNGDYVAYCNLSKLWLEHILITKEHFDTVVLNGASDDFLVMFLNRHVDIARRDQVNRFMLEEHGADLDRQDAEEGYT